MDTKNIAQEILLMKGSDSLGIILLDEIPEWF